MKMRKFMLGIGVAVLAGGEASDAALIKNIGAKTSGTVKITTTTKGQRQIALTIDPGGAVTAFRLDVVYQPKFVTPEAFDGFVPFLTDEAVQFVPPYGGAVGGGATILPTTPGLISNVEGAYVFPAPVGPLAAPAPVPNRPDGGSDLFTLFFIDNAPTVDKVFTILGVDDKGIDPDFAPYIADNFLDIYVDDPNDP